MERILLLDRCVGKGLKNFVCVFFWGGDNKQTWLPDLTDCGGV